jgi:hypothetical protein
MKEGTGITGVSYEGQFPDCKIEEDESGRVVTVRRKRTITHKGMLFKRDSFQTPGGFGRTIEPGHPGSIRFYCDTYPCRVLGYRLNGRMIITERAAYGADPKTENPMGHQNWIVEEGGDGRLDVFTWRPKYNCYRMKGSAEGLGLDGYQVYYCWEF